MDVTICVSTYGSTEWAVLGSRNAELHRARGWNAIVNHSYGDFTISDSRNFALEMVKSEYVIFLDADDSLEITYLEEMAKGTADVRVPAVRYIRNGIRSVPHVPTVVSCTHQDEPCAAPCLVRGNYVVIGAVVRTEAVKAIGGFHDWPIYEDWDLWLRMYLAGYSFETIPTAVYLATVNPNSRNRAPSKAEKEQTHKLIARANGI